MGRFDSYCVVRFQISRTTETVFLLRDNKKGYIDNQRSRLTNNTGILKDRL